jgi:hypothetical protein
VSVQVTSAGGWRPVVVLSGPPRSLAPFVERLARAGFATVACDPRSPDELTTVLEALERGDLGVVAASYGVVECASEDSVRFALVRASARRAGPLPLIHVPADGFNAICQWLLHELA